MRVMHRSSAVPDGVPVLSRGKHRRPRTGACFMEFASYLAGERWSDHPRCTHPTLATLARTVNDLVDDEHRAALVPWIPDVVGLAGTDALIGLTITARAAMAALPIASRDEQRPLAVALLTVDRVLGSLSGAASRELREEIAEVLALAPHEVEWARAFSARTGAHGAPAWSARTAAQIVNLACIAISRALVLDPDDRLIALLRGCIDETQALVSRPLSVPAAPEPAREVSDSRL